MGNKLAKKTEEIGFEVHGIIWPSPPLSSTKFRRTSPLKIRNSIFTRNLFRHKSTFEITAACHRFAEDLSKHTQGRHVNVKDGQHTEPLSRTRTTEEVNPAGAITAQDSPHDAGFTKNVKEAIMEKESNYETSLLEKEDTENKGNEAKIDVLPSSDNLNYLSKEGGFFGTVVNSNMIDEDRNNNKENEIDKEVKESHDLDDSDVRSVGSHQSDFCSEVGDGSQTNMSRLLSDHTGILPGDWKKLSYPYENVVMSGGGTKGYAFIGALKALEDSGILTKVKRVAGSSVGAICAGLLAIGCSPQEIANVFSVDVKWLFHDEKFEKLFCLPNVLRGYGIHKAERFYRILGRHFELKVSDPDITFGQLYKKLGRELCIVVTNLTKMRSEYCHHTTTPDMPIRKAVRMSMAFPVVYKPVQHETNGALSWYTDGGMLDQYPVHCFDDLAVDLNQNQNDRKSPRNWKTVGLYVVSESPLDYEIWRRLFGQEIPFRPGYVPDTKLARSRMKKDHPKKRKTHSERSSKKHKHNINGSIKSYDSRESIYEWPESRREISIKSFGEFMITTIEALLLHQRKLTIQPADIDRTIPINCGYIATNDYHLEAGDREFMLRQGYECTRQFLIRHAQNAQKSREKEEIAQHEEQQPTETSSESENQTEMKRSSTSARFVLVNQNSIETEV